LPAAPATDTNPAIGPATGSAAATQTAPPQATETISPGATISATETYVPAQPAVIRNPAPLRDVIAAGTNTVTYTVQPGDSVAHIAGAIGDTSANLRRLNGMSRSEEVQAGESIVLHLPYADHAPAIKLMPDSEVVNSPTAARFDMAQFMAEHPNSYLNRYSEKFDGQDTDGPHIVLRIAQELSVHPRILLALLEYAGGWISNPSPAGNNLLYPLGIKNANRRSLSKQLSWAGARLNEGYYGWRLANRLWVQFPDNSHAYVGSDVNAGTAAVQNYLAAIGTRPALPGMASDGPHGFVQTYRRLFGDPWQFDLGTLVPDNVRQPAMSLPFPKGEMWMVTGGPHAAWGTGSPWAALDFAPRNSTSCRVLPGWINAVAPGTIARSIDGEVAESLDPSGDERIGWSVFYMHVGTLDRIGVGQVAQMGDHIGHPSCEGGDATGSHLHMARKYNGEWIPAGGNIPFDLSGWIATDGDAEYDGVFSNGQTTRYPCDCKDPDTNGIVW
jgi:hypothetical protein